MEWISVEEDMPRLIERYDYLGVLIGEFSDYVVVLDKDFGWSKGLYDKENGWMKDHSAKFVGKITHWAYIEPPKE